MATALRCFTLALSSLISVGACKTKPSTAPPESALPDDGNADGFAAQAADDGGEESGGEAEGDDGPDGCGGDPLTVKFYDAGQALAVLVTLPDGRHVLVDTGESPTRPGCSPCKAWHKRVVDGLKADLGDTPIDMLWVTHQHSDHHGGLPGIAAAGIQINAYVDNGQEPTKNGVDKARKAAQQAGASLHEIQPAATELPIEDTDDVDLEAVVPQQWPVDCAAHPNDCSIGLKITYCNSSILFTGDAELDPEKAWEVGDIDLLQVGHHGSATSCSSEFLEKTKPNYAVASSAKIGAGTNKGYCHPRQVTVESLNSIIDNGTQGWVMAFDGAVKCANAGSSNWKKVPTSSTTWYTSRDGDVVLVTKGDGTFERVQL